jgi:hypothetical protein
VIDTFAHLLNEQMRQRINLLGSFRDFARLDATGADLHANGSALRALNTNGLQVRIEATARAIVSMRNIIAELRRLAADFATFSHNLIPPGSEKARERFIC